MKKTYDFNIDGNVVALTPDTESDKESPKKKSVKFKKHPEYSRAFSLSSYIDPEALRTFLSRCAWVQHFALAHHDKDNKEPHTHVILYTYSAKTSSAVLKNFDRFSREYYKDKGEPQNTLCEIANDVTSLWRYLIHADDPDKYQYDPSIRKTDNLDYWQKYEKTDGLNDSANNYGLAIFEDMLNGTNTRDMILKYGKEYIYHANHFKGVVNDHFREEAFKVQHTDDVNRKVLFEIDSTVRELTAEVSGQYTEAQCKLFAEMLTQSLNNLSVLTDKVIFIREVK